MLRSARIMRRARREVNDSRAPGAIACVVIALVVALAACGGAERRADRLWRESLDKIAKGDAAGAATLLQRILDEYPDTEVASKAREKIVVYRGIASAVENYPSRRAREIMIQVARAIEAYRSAERRVPASLQELVPNRLDAVPADPWNHQLSYDVVGTGYRLRCLGDDGAPGGEGAAADLVVQNGEFVAGRP